MSLFQRLCCIFCMLFGLSLNAFAEANGIADSAPILEACQGKPRQVGDICRSGALSNLL